MFYECGLVVAVVSVVTLVFVSFFSFSCFCFSILLSPLILISVFAMSIWSTDSSMASSAFNIASDLISEQPPAISVEMVEVKDNVLVCDTSNSNVAHSSTSVNSLLHMATENCGKAFNIFFQSSKTSIFPSVTLVQFKLKLRRRKPI